ncbi:cellular tumor antigen p53-like [Topomyia yanbarensis]|uniref:cellular tumor antigen p53-like n=1 Tax=Topomyia yanbarensis TaxID=2498891 RepID=UPI00273A8F2D|nr:cellular tumor antigen p53-like [Topomyia yanbarensis]
MVDSRETNQTYGRNQQPVDDCDAALLSQIPTSELMMDLDGGMFQLEPYQEVLKLESLPDMDQCDQSMQIPKSVTPLVLDHMNKTPTLEEYHDPVFNFHVDLNGETSGKSSWMFSSRLNKVFVKMGQACTFNVSYQSLNFQELQVRAMLVCSAPEDMHYPVFRCENHRCSDNSKLPEDVKSHVMRCFNPSARYVGSESGVAYQERLAVIIPLGSTTQDQASMNVSLEFVCQNSCRIINRRATAIIFTLEDVHGQILGKKSLHLKVCSCPKRDKQKEEECLAPTKRKSEEQLQAPHGKKVAKVSTAHRNPTGQQRPQRTSPPLPGKLAYIKKEGSPDSSPTSAFHHRRARSLTPYSSQELIEQPATTISIPLPSVPAAVKVAEYAFQVVAGDLVRCVDDDQRKHLAAFLTKIRRLQKRLTTGHTAYNTNSSTDSE